MQVPVGRGTWNEDEIAPNNGCLLHGHAYMEIVTYVREGERFGRISSQMSAVFLATQHVGQKMTLFSIGLDDGYAVSWPSMR